MSLFGISNNKVFDKLIDKATSPILIEPDWEAILQLCDIVKSQEVTAKYAVQAIKKKFSHENALVTLNSLHCLESIVKNCGATVHKEVAQKDMTEALRELAKNGVDGVRDKILELIQCWSYGLGQQHKIFTETYNLMKLEGFRFPPLKESEVMFENSDIAPEWRDNKVCFRCRQLFTTFNRKHHCRACGEIFCDKCSSKQCAIPKYGIDRDVRVCDACYDKLTSGSVPIVKPISSPQLVKPTVSTTPAQTKTQAELDEEESLQLALAISQSEAEEKERQKKMLTQKYAMSSSLSAPNAMNNNISNIAENNNNNEYAELTKYIEKGRQEQQQQREKLNSTNVSNGHAIEANAQLPNELQGFITDNEVDQFTAVVTDHINNFKFRMLSNQQRSRNVTNDTAVQSVFVMLQHFHPELHRFMQLLEDKRTYYENLQDKLNQLKDAREALNALRTEHNERRQQEALERERQRQMQLAQKLDVMRQKKQEYLEYQRQLHLQRLAQQEIEMKARLEQQRQLTLAREQYVQNPQLSLVSYDYNRPPQQYNPAYQPSFTTLPTQPSSESATQYSIAPQVLTQQQQQQQQQQQPLLPPSHYSRVMMYPPTLDTNILPQVPTPLTMPSIPYPMGTTGDNNYSNPYGQMAMTNATIPYTQQQQSTPTVNDGKSEPQLITFD